MELVLNCDFAYASETATFGQPETKRGIIPGAMGTVNLPRACGLRRAKELIFTGETFSAEQAASWGIVNKIYASEQLSYEVLNTAKIIAENAPVAVKQAKRSLQHSLDYDLHTAYLLELECYNKTIVTYDREEGIRAFAEKRKPKFIGE